MAWVYSLRDYELIYELKLRGKDRVSSNTVDLNRGLLKGLLARARREGTAGKEENKYDRSVDLEEIGVTLQDLKDKLTSGVAISSTKEEGRFLDRLQHLSARISRVAPLANSSSEEDIVGELADECLLLEGQLGEKKAPNNEISRATGLAEPIGSQRDPAVQSTPAQSLALGIPNVSESIRKWNVRFSGQEAPDNLFDFLESIEDLKISRGVTEQQLFNAAVELFSDDARIWFRRNRTGVNNWSELVQLLKQSFLPYHHDRDLQEIVSSTYQKPTENVSVFIAKMEAVFARMAVTPAEADRVEQIREHLLPFFISQTSTLGLRSIQELDRICVLLERSRLCAAKAEGLVSLQERGHQVAPWRRQSTVAIATENRSQRSVPFSCWNCAETGHLFSSCSKDKRKFCYRCGEPNVTVLSCLNCKKNGRRPEVPGRKPSGQ